MMRPLFLLAMLFGAAFFTPKAQAADANVITWYASRTLPQQVSWEPVRATDPARLFRQSYLLSELTLLAKGNSPSTSHLDELGFRYLSTLHGHADIDAGDVGSFLKIGGGSLHSAIIGDAAISDMKAEADAMAVESKDGSVRVIAIRGSEFKTDLFDSLLNLNAATIVEDGITYHHGFYVYASILYGQVLASLGNACEPGGQHVWLTGHSLGGAAAEILALWLSRSGCQVDGVISFAAPLPGRSNLKAAYDNEGLDDLTQRWVHETDPVPCMPLGTGWAELGQRHTLGDTGYRLNDPIDHCDEGDGSLEARVYATMLKLYDFGNFSMPFEQWLEETGEQTGFCTKKWVWRALLGVLTGGGSELTCRSLDEVTDVRSVADQVLRSVLLLLENMDFADHRLPQCLYVDRIAEEGQADGAYDSIWDQRMERAWQVHPECVPPSWTPGASQPVKPPPPQSCPATYRCCEPRGDGSCPAQACQPASRECA